MDFKMLFSKKAQDLCLTAKKAIYQAIVFLAKFNKAK